MRLRENLQPTLKTPGEDGRFTPPASSCLQLWVRVCTSALSCEIWPSISFRSPSFTFVNWVCRRRSAAVYFMVAFLLNCSFNDVVLFLPDEKTDLIRKIDLLFAVRLLLYLALQSQQLHGFDHSLVNHSQSLKWWAASNPHRLRGKEEWILTVLPNPCCFCRLQKISWEL